MDQLGHTDPKLALRIYARTMRFTRAKETHVQENPGMGAAGIEPATSRV
jgi:hypothetical protein